MGVAFRSKFHTYEWLEKPGIIMAFNEKIISANKSALKIFSCVDIKNQMK